MFLHCVFCCFQTFFVFLVALAITVNMHCLNHIDTLNNHVKWVFNVVQRNVDLKSHGLEQIQKHTTATGCRCQQHHIWLSKQWKHNWLSFLHVGVRLTANMLQYLQKRKNKILNHSSIIHTHPFNGRFSGTNQVSRYQKGKTNLDFSEARDSEWQWASAGPCASLHLAPDR